jgi:gas vesicle protein
MSDRDEFGAFLVGFVVGGLAGAVTALLLAPQSGEETRTVIKERAIELKDKASDTFDDAYDKAGEYAQTARAKAVELQHKGQVVLEEQKSKLTGGKKDVKPVGDVPA